MPALGCWSDVSKLGAAAPAVECLDAAGHERFGAGTVRRVGTAHGDRGRRRAGDPARPAGAGGRGGRRRADHAVDAAGDGRVRALGRARRGGPLPRRRRARRADRSRLHTRSCRPGFPHTYGTEPGQRWTELFAVFTGPLFDSLADLGILAAPGPRYPRPIAVDRGAADRAADAAAVAACRRAPVARAGRLAARHRGRRRPTRRGPTSASRSPPPWSRLADDLTGSSTCTTVAADIGLTYDTFRRRFAAQVGQTPAAFRMARRRADRRHAAAAHRHDAPRDRAHAGLRRRVPPLPAVPRAVRRSAARLPPDLTRLTTRA